jgi:dTDP-4-amino-4,6-dideoxygalactose transaminase
VGKYRIPFNKPSFAGDENRYIADAIARGHISGDGHYTKLCHALFERELGVEKALLTTNCTHALEMSALLCRCGPGDEVIVPSFAFVTTVLAFVMRGAKPVFVDVLPGTLGIDPAQVEARITPRTKAIVALHYAGVACEMDELLAIGARHGVPIVEDNAHGLYGKYKGRWLGTMGVLATQSFHETKNFTCGEGGALLVNDPALVERAEIVREKGTNRSRFLRGLVHKYTWVDLGSSWLPSDMVAAFLWAQLEARERIQSRRRSIWERYDRELGAWAGTIGATQPKVPADREQSWHMYHLLLRDSAQRERLIDHLEARGILAVFHYLPLHLSEMGRKFGGKEGDCPTTEDISSRLLRLPFFNALSEDEQGDVVRALHEFEG